MKKHLVRAFIGIFVFTLSLSPLQGAGDKQIPRTVILLCMVNKQDKVGRARLGQILESPLNHLGLVVEYHNILDGLPDIDKRKDIRGILTWYDQGKHIESPKQYVQFLSHQIDLGRKVVIMEEPGFFDDVKGWDTQAEDINKLLSKLGILFTGQRVTHAYGIKIVQKDNFMVDFERPYDDILPAFDMGQILNESAHSYLDVQSNDELFSLITTNENGGYVSEGYSLYTHESNTSNYRAWHLNPFAYFRNAFGLKGLPAPDTTTLVGHRIFYSHVDGDGWNNLTQLEAYKEKQTLCAEVLYERVLTKYPDIPVSIGVIGADVDTGWAGQQKSIDIGTKIYQLPHVEIASHTYSHPFSWEFFSKPDYNEREKLYFPYYPAKYTWKTPSNNSGLIHNITEAVRQVMAGDKPKETPPHLKIDNVYDIPRGFAHKKFDLGREIQGSCQRASDLGPTGKTAQIILWSGNTSPNEAALGMAHDRGVENINGGDTRFDWEYNSYAWVSPKGRKVGPYWQIYTCNANETIYTDTWKRRFYAFEELKQTVENTETPLRINAHNVYYHTYIAEKEASLKSLIYNLEYARNHDINPIPASQYARIVQGFYKTTLIQLSDGAWRVENRGDLQTLRFDKALLRAVDFPRSKGVLGQRHFQGSLYVFLDPGEKAPVVTLKTIQDFGAEIPESIPYIIASNWQIQTFKPSTRGVGFRAHGYGNPVFKIKMPKKGSYTVTVVQNGKKIYAKSHRTTERALLHTTLPIQTQDEITLRIKRDRQNA